MVPHPQSCSARFCPFHCVNAPQGGIDGKALRNTQVSIQWIFLSAECVHVTDHGTLSPRFTEHVGVTRVEALDGCSFVSCREWADEVLAQSYEGDVSVEWGTILFTNDHERLRIGF